MGCLMVLTPAPGLTAETDMVRCFRETVLCRMVKPPTKVSIQSELNDMDRSITDHIYHLPVLFYQKGMSSLGVAISSSLYRK